MLSKETTGLVIVDVQGKLASIVHDSVQVVANLVTLVKAANRMELPIIWLEQNPEKLGDTIPELRELLTSSPRIAKYTFSACGEPAFVKAVKQAKRENWLMTGIEAHICVYQTAMDMKALGYSVELVADCVSSRRVENKDLAVAKLARAGVETTCLEMCLFELIKDCRAAEFKDALRLIK
ncbi:hydrolase [Marinomonas sp. A79]|uniref:Hydrolase n=1 Tax=Marinomonas vulgaris TaxID=2823372 RepID=A0ABS5HD55_9GAMM|nr:hydrolase [Marinomonas vulgaris]MBR7889591.1 hydrolase [Marinomonas vulgaris]